MALHLCKPKHRSLTNPFLIHLFSTSQNDNNNNDDGNDNNSSQSSQSRHVSIQKLYKRNTNNDAEPSGTISLEGIREKLQRAVSVYRSNVGSSADLRESLVRLKAFDEEKAKKSSTQRLDNFGQLGGIPNFMHRPKKHLVEKFFHPDNMSSVEKMKNELAKVREEFKKAESNFGSVWVEVASLTIKIKRFSSALEQIINEYNELLATQLENQKLYYETLLREVKEETDKRRTSEDLYNKVMVEKLPEMRYKLDQCVSEKRDLRENLLEVQEMWKAKISEMEEREKTALRAKDDKIQYLEELLRNLKVYLKAEKTEEQLSISNEIKDGTVLPMSEDSSTSKGTKVGKGKKSNRGRSG